ncbi:hypothetical protein [Bacillus sp. GB_SG_008]|uniref:hypothetical protein n=1 Tax=Bacillus sp. GB_SG_008 TaxID=3454627 RepID=UPI003F86B5D8
MEDIYLQSDVFKFLSIRPPKKISPESEEKRFIYDNRKPEESIVLKELTQFTASRIREESPISLTRRLIQANGYALDYSKDVNYQWSMGINKIIQDQFNSHEWDAQSLLKKIKNLLGASPVEFVKKKEFINFFAKLWDSLYAFQVLNHEEVSNLEELILQLRILHVLDYLSKHESFQNMAELKDVYNAVPALPKEIMKPIVGDVTDLARVIPIHVDILPDPGTIRPLGFGDVKVVKQKLQKYVDGEVAHIENVLKSEHKDRKHRRLDRTEETFITIQDNTEVNERDTQSTDRFELKNEADKIIKSDEAVKAGVNVTATYGPVVISAHGDYASNTSTSESTRNSTNFSKDIMDRSVSKVTKRTREERIRKTIQEIEEINDHGFDNTAPGTENISGIYRWVDKHYKAQVYNYGPRLMFEFIVPEPAAFYIYKQISQPEREPIIKPEMPARINFPPSDITPANYLLFMNQYKVTGVSPPPDEFITISIALDQPVSDQPLHTFTKSTSEVKVPPGYKAIKNMVIFNPGGGPPGPAATSLFASVTVGMSNYVYQTGQPFVENLGKMVSDDMSKDQDNTTLQDGTVPITILTMNIEAYTANIKILCQRTSEKLEEWQNGVYKAIVDAYKVMVDDFNKSIKDNQPSSNFISGNNPNINRTIEKEELKRWCINLFTNQNFSIFKAMQEGDPSTYPEIDVDRARSEGKYIQFFEQAFEWENITYVFYPYFWGKKKNWVQHSQHISLQDPDPLFTQFLQAGSARVIVPVRLAYENAVLYYLQTKNDPLFPGIIWGGGDPPTLCDPLYLSIVDELKDQQDPLHDGVLEAEWDVIIPTTLVHLQKDSTLPDLTTTGP